MNNNINAVFTIALRDVTKLLRDKFRILANFVFPIIFIGVLGVSMQANLKDDLPYNFLVFVFTGVLGQTLFQSTAGGIISLIEDRQNDFAQELFVSPVSRYAIIIGKIFGESIVALIQCGGILIFGFLFGVPLSIIGIIQLLPFALLITIFGGAFGLLVMSNINDQKSVNQFFPFLIFPQFFLAGVFNLVKELPMPLLIASRIAPMTYAIDLIRSVYYYGTPNYQYTVIFNPIINLIVVSSATLLFLLVGTYRFVQKEKNK